MSLCLPEVNNKARKCQETANSRKKKQTEKFDEGKEARKEEKTQPLSWPKGPLLESRNETALSSPGNDAFRAAAILDSLRG
jgi:hypothetical protein